MKVENVILLSFDQALDDDADLLPTSFSVNYGKIPVNSANYYGTAMVALTIDKAMTYRDKLEVNYQPPELPIQALRGLVPPNPTPTALRRAAVRAFYKVPVLNQLPTFEGNWNGMSNLGGGGAILPDENDPDGGFDWEASICGPNGGGIIIRPDGDGTPNGNNFPPDGGGPNVSPYDSGTGGGGGAGGGTNPNGPQTYKDLGYPQRIYPRPRVATPDDFVLAYGLREAIQLTNIDDADATQPNTEKLWMAIQDAAALVDNYITQASRAGKVLISSNRRRTTLIIARYYLDTVRRREDVKADYEACISELDKKRSLEDGIRPDLPWWADPCNPWRGRGVLSHRIPQYYNGVSGKGLSGWWSDAGYSEVDDFRYDRDNAEANNDQGNMNGGEYRSRFAIQPTDDGGDTQGTP